ncbi:hypothetical protein E1B28_010454 [Marasmius oreades]|uniref:Uncharacterized protein n=1 Tax=Marasmius oreades TaxID=181124 RepID=A0A9P7RXS9_9AGAR|nr:uncharacterized protein E1B28_010454 [Marasmius oreades]KAG7091418.1 hypothetical protein E1B28_010454 [Marasmius oreades]
MASIIWSAKSGSDWSDSDLDAYNITVVPVQPSEFFPNPDPSLDHIDPEILSSPFDATPLSLDAARYLRHLRLAIDAHQESFVDDFAAGTLRLLGFDQDIDPQSLLDTTFVLLVLVEDKTLANQTHDVEAQVIAEAIAAFQSNNDKRTRRWLDPLQSMTIPCITMIGTLPTFYLVPVTRELSAAVISGEYPATPTQVLQCRTELDSDLDSEAGMEDIEYRQLAFKRFLAFKTLARTHWEPVLQGF